MEKKKIITIAILGITVVLALIASFTAFRLYQIGKKPVTSPKPKPKPSPQKKAPEVFPQEPMPCQTTFTVPPQTSPSPSPSPSPGAQCTEDARITVIANQDNTATITASASIGYTDVEIRVTTASATTPYQNPTIQGHYSWAWTINTALANINSVNFYVGVTGLGENGELCGTWLPGKSPSPSPSPETSPSPSPSPETSPSPSPTPLPECWQTCTSDSQCPSSLSCQNANGETRCVNPNCPEKTDCLCSISQASLPPSSTETTYTPPKEELPSAGIVSPTLALGLGGILLVILGILL